MSATKNPYNRINAQPDAGIGAGVILLDMSPTCGPRVLMLHNRRENCWCFIKGKYAPEDRGYSLNAAVRKTRELTGLENVRDYRIVGRQMRFGKRMYWIGIMNNQQSRDVRSRVYKYSRAAWFDTANQDLLNGTADVRAWQQKGRNPNGLFQETLTSWRQHVEPSRH